MAYIDHHILRLMHFDNVEHILKHGMYSKNSGHVIPNYVNKGKLTAGHSPMLLNIKNGSRGIKQLPQKDLVYVVCRISGIIEHCLEWCFTDGHAKNHLTRFYNHTDDLTKLDWEVISMQ